MFNVEKAVSDYREYASELTDNGQIYYLKGNANVADKLSVVENIVVINAIKASKTFINHKKLFLVPALDIRRAEQIIREHEKHILDFIEFINIKRPTELDFASFQKYVDYVSSNYRLDSFEIVKAFVENKKCLNMLITIAKLRAGDAVATGSSASAAKKAVR